MDDPRPDAPQLELTTPPAAAEDALQLGPADAAAVDPPAGDNPFAMQTTPPAVPAARADAPPMKASKPVTAAANDSVVAALMGRPIAKAQSGKTPVAKAKAAEAAASGGVFSVAATASDFLSTGSVPGGQSGVSEADDAAARAADREVELLAAVEESTARAVASDTFLVARTGLGVEAGAAVDARDVVESPSPAPIGLLPSPSPDELQVEPDADEPDADEAAILAHLIDVAGIDSDESGVPRVGVAAAPETTAEADAVADVIAEPAPTRPAEPTGQSASPAVPIAVSPVAPPVVPAVVSPVVPPFVPAVTRPPVPVLAAASMATPAKTPAPLRLPEPTRRAVPVTPVWPTPQPVAAVATQVRTTSAATAATVRPAAVSGRPATATVVAGSTGAWFTIPLLFVGISVVACAILVPAADENRRDTYELARMERDVDYFKRQSDVNADFLQRVNTDATLAERLAMRQLHQTRQGTRLAPLAPPTERFGMSPYAMTRLDPPAALPPYAPTRGILSEYFLDARRQTKTVALGILLAGAGLLLGGTGRPRLVRPATPVAI